MEITYNNEKIRLNVSDTGKGDAVLLLHGWGTSLAVYKNIISWLTPYKRVISYDLPGFGESPVPSFAFSTDDYANIAIAVLKEAGIKKATVIGHSHGGRTALNLASRQNAEIELEKIILIDSAGIVPKKIFIQKLQIMQYKLVKKILLFSPIHNAFPNAIETYKSKHGSQDYKSVSGVVRESLVKVVNDDYKDRMKNIKIPTLLIWGTNDSATPLSDGEFMEKNIPDSGLIKIQGGSHFSFLDNPHLVKKVIFSFLNIDE